MRDRPVQARFIAGLRWVDMFAAPAPSALFASALLLVGCGAAAGSPGRGEGEGPRAAGPVQFVRETHRSNVMLTVLRRGTLALDAQGCLRLGDSALVWPAEAALDLSEPGVVKIVDRRDGSTVRVGEAVALGGGGYPAGYAPETNRPLAPCGGRIWNVDSFRTAADWEAERAAYDARMFRSAPGAPPQPTR